MLQRISHIFIYVIFMALYLGLCFLCGQLGIGAETKVLRFVLFFGGIFLSFVLTEYLWSLYAIKKLNTLRPLLFKNSANPHLYIKEVNQLIKDTTNATIHTLCYINLAAAYSMQGDYRAAKEQLYKVDTRVLKEPVLTNYWICYIGHHFDAEEDNYALQCMNEHAAQLHQYRTHPELGGYIVSLELYRKLALNQTEGLALELENARRNWPADAFVDEFDRLEKRMIEKGLK